MKNYQGKQSLRQSNDYIYVNSKSIFLNTDTVPEDFQRTERIKSFLKLYEKSSELVVFCGREITAENVYIRLQKQFETNQLSVQELFRNLNIEKENLNDIFETLFYQKRKGFFGKRHYVAESSWTQNGKQELANLLKKKLIVYETPEKNHGKYNPELYTPYKKK